MEPREGKLSSHRVVQVGERTKREAHMCRMTRSIFLRVDDLIS